MVRHYHYEVTQKEHAYTQNISINGSNNNVTQILNKNNDERNEDIKIKEVNFSSKIKYTLEIVKSLFTIGGTNIADLIAKISKFLI